MNLDLSDAGPFGFGCGPLGHHRFGEVDLDECRAAVASALDAGITLFDTADVYGRGASEEQLAKALGKRRSLATIATKGGVRLDSQGRSRHDSSPAWLNQALEGSLRRLKTEVIDLYQIHYVDDVTPIEDSLDYLESVRLAGKIRAYGVSNVRLDDLPETSHFPNLVSHSFEFSMLNVSRLPDITANLRTLPQATHISTGVLAQGLLGGRYGRGSVFGANDRRRDRQRLFAAEQWDRNERVLDVLQTSDHPPADLAIAWSVASSLWPPGSRRISLVGIKNQTQLESVFRARDLVSTFDWDDLDAVVAELPPA